MPHLKFTKMHGLGNDFMVVNAIGQTFRPDPAQIAAWANRHTGIGFDQLLVVEQSSLPEADFRYRIFNADGSEVEQCGNGARCFARFVREEGLTDKDEIVVETARGLIVPKLNGNGLVTVNMGPPRFAAAEVPFVLRAEEQEEQKTYVVVNGLDSAPMAVLGMGNPHAVMLVDDTETAPVAAWGEALQSHPRFPERVNVGFLQIVGRREARLRVYERGSGETLACGTGACAAAVAGIRWNLLDADADIRISLRGGDLFVRWQPGADVLMTGPAVRVYDGGVEIDAA